MGLSIFYADATLMNPSFGGISSRSCSAGCARYYRKLAVKMQLPIPVTADPNARDFCVAGHRVSATRGCLGGVIGNGCDVSSEERNVRLKDGDRCEAAVLVKLFHESQDLVPVPYVLFHVGEVRKKQFPKICSISIHIRFHPHTLSKKHFLAE